MPRPGGNLIPSRVLLREVGVHASVLEWIERASEERIDLLHRRPYVAQIDVAAVDRCERLAREIDVDSAGNGERHDERRAHEEVRLHALVDARFEVAVPRQHACGDEVVRRERVFELAIERARIADARRAAESDDVEAEPVEERLQAGLREVLAHDTRAGASEVFTHGLTLSPCSTAFFASRPAASITAGFDVLVHDVIAAITTSPCVSSTVDGRAAACSTGRAGSASAGCSSSRLR